MNSNHILSEEQIEKAYNAVFRNSTNQPGFYFWDLGNKINSRNFRRQMIILKNGLSKRCKIQLNKKLNYQNIGRFNHQNSSKLHRDTAGNFSFLMLGYKPTKVDSNVFVADYTKYIESEQISLKTFFAGDYDANLIEDESILTPFKREITPFLKENYRILLLNNCKSFEEASFGIFHGAKMPKINNKEDRIINYMMMQLCNKNEKEQYNLNDIIDFETNNYINR